MTTSAWYFLGALIDRRYRRWVARLLLPLTTGTCARCPMISAAYVSRAASIRPAARTTLRLSARDHLAQPFTIVWSFPYHFTPITKSNKGLVLASLSMVPRAQELARFPP